MPPSWFILMNLLIYYIIKYVCVKMDVSGDGGIDIDEFDSLHQTIMDEHGEEEEDIREVFNMFNQNGYEFLCESCSCFVRTIDQDCKQMIKKNGH